MERTNNTPTCLFTWPFVAAAAAVFAALTIGIQRTLRYVCDRLVTFDCAYYWPVSVFGPRTPSVREMAVAAVVLAGFFLLYRGLEAVSFDPKAVALSGVLLIVGLTYIHGLDEGFYAPVAGDAQHGELVPYSLEGQEYFHDALSVEDPLIFLRQYNVIQPTLHRHGHTHPPGAVLTFWLLKSVFGDPALIGVVLMLLALPTTVYFAYRLFAAELDAGTSGYLSLLFVLLPAVQIYYLATIDAIVAALLTACVYLFCFGRGKWAVAGAAATLTASFLLTFVSLFMLPVLVGFEAVRERSIKRSALVIGFAAAFHLVLYAVFGYNAWQSFRTASIFENPNGFMLFVDPWNYFFTRFEDVAEIVFFFGPFLTVLAVRGFRNVRTRPLALLTALAGVTMLGMFATGAFRTGETARACMFLYPYLLMPVGYHLADTGTTLGGRLQLSALVFFQAVVMQLLGNYHW